VAELSSFCSSVQVDEYDFQPESNGTLSLCPETLVKHKMSTSKPLLLTATSYNKQMIHDYQEIINTKTRWPL